MDVYIDDSPVSSAVQRTRTESNRYAYSNIFGDANTCQTDEMKRT